MCDLKIKSCARALLRLTSETGGIPTRQKTTPFIGFEAVEQTFQMHRNIVLKLDVLTPLQWFALTALRRDVLAARNVQRQSAQCRLDSVVTLQVRKKTHQTQFTITASTSTNNECDDETESSEFSEHSHKHSGHALSDCQSHQNNFDL